MVFLLEVNRHHCNDVGMNTKKITTRQIRIEKIKQEILKLGEMTPGSLSKQYNVCGNPRCRCKDPDNPKKHGPYYNLSYTWNGKGKTEFVRKERVALVRQQIRNYRTFKRLIKRWVDLSLEIAELRKER